MPNSAEDIIRNEFKKFLRDGYDGDFDKIPLADLGIDSLSFFEAIMTLEDEHRIFIPESHLHSSITLEEIFAIADRRHDD